MMLPIPESTMLEATASARVSGRGAVDVLQDMLHGADPELLIRRLGATLALPALDMSDLRTLLPNFDLISFADCMRRSCISGTLAGERVAVVGDPFDLDLQVWLNNRVGAVKFMICQKDNIAALLATHEEGLRAIRLEAYDEHETSSGLLEEITLASIADVANSTVRVVNSTIYDAIKLGASDIHLESTSRGLAIRFRIDGVLDPVTQVSGMATAQEIVSRIKVIAELDISERRTPQDGRFKLSVKGRPVDFRVSVMPSIFGEDIVIRILDKRSLSDQLDGLRLEKLGFDEKTLTELRKLSREPYGMLLVTGPTGSGKTTTLYAAISEIYTGQDKIITIEDPVEYQLSGILQIPVNEKKGLTFARGLRSILRHDPDKILVGEIRDSETAQIAIQSALTGHLVFTSVHANNVLDVLGRFRHMGVDPYSFISAVNGILAQRLVRLNCTACAEAVTPEPELLRIAQIPATLWRDAQFKIGRGCGQCRGSGYRGRHAIGEVLILNDSLREMIVSRAPISDLKEHARRSGTRFLRESAVALAVEGRTTLEEIGRVTFVE